MYEDGRRYTYNRRPKISRAEYMRRQKLMKKRRRKKVIVRIAVIFIVMLILAAVTFGAVFFVKTFRGISEKKSDSSGVDVSGLETETSEKSEESPSSDGELDLIAVGDILMHTPLLRYFKNDSGTYDFSAIFSELKETISKADLAVCNQETPINTDADADGGSDYVFNAPKEIGEAEIAAGFDLILQSSNHSYDQGSDGILNTVAFWKSKADQVTMIGMYDSEEDRDTPTVLEINGIKIGVYNCTYGLNGFSLPSDMPYLTNLLVEDNYEMIVSDIEELESLSDIVIVFPHWGTEDLTVYTTEDQDYWAKVLTEAGADVIIGTHPHVCEKIEWVSSDNGNRCLCYYSIGNFATNQQELPEVLCGMAKVHIVKDEDVTYVDESETGVIPLVTHNIYMGAYEVESLGTGWVNSIVVYKLSDYTETMAAEHDIANRWDSSFSLEGLESLAEETFSGWIIDY